MGKPVEYTVLNRKKFGDADAKKKFQFEHNGEPQKAGDTLTLDPDAMLTKEYLGRGLIKESPVKEVPEKKAEKKTSDKGNNK